MDNTVCFSSRLLHRHPIQQRARGAVLSDVDFDVVVVGAGPTGLMLAGDLAGAGVRTLVLERRAEPSATARAGGLAGHTLDLLYFRGELERFRPDGMEAPPADPPPRFPFGGLHLDFSGLSDPPMRTRILPQMRLEAILAERAVERGARITRAHELIAFTPHDQSVSVDVRGPRGLSEVTAGYLVGCDGGRSRVRELAQIGFRGVTLPEVERLATVTVPDAVEVLDDGGLQVRGGGRLSVGYTATEHGVFACFAQGETMTLYTAEVEETAPDDTSMTTAELNASIQRVLGIDLPMGEPLQMTRFGYLAKQADTYRQGRVLLAGDAAHLFPAGGVAINAGLLDAANLGWKLAAAVEGWAPPDLLDTYDVERRTAAERTLMHTRAQVALRRGHGPFADALRSLFSELTKDEQPLRRLGALMAGTDIGSPRSTGHRLQNTLLSNRALGIEHRDPRLAGILRGLRPVVLHLTDRADFSGPVQPWADRVDIGRLVIDDPPADALLLLPDTRVGWAASVGEPQADAVPALRAALTSWVGPPAE